MSKDRILFFKQLRLARRGTSAFNGDERSHTSTIDPALMPKVTHPREDHRQSESVCCRDHFFIFHGSTRLNHSRDYVFRSLLYAVREGKEGIRGKHRPGKRQNGFGRADFYAVYTAHLSCADRYALTCPRIHNRVRFNVFADLPGELERRKFLCARCTSGLNLQARAIDFA